MNKYTLHRIAVNEWNEEPGFALRNPDGEAFPLYDESDMRAQYEVLKAYFEEGAISPEPVEIEEIEGGWTTLEGAVWLARQYSAKATVSDDRIMATVSAAAEAGRLGQSHPTLDGADWWFDKRALDDYLFRLKWGERRPIPPTDKPTITLPDEPFGSLFLSDALADGSEIAHQEKGVWYKLYLSDQGQIVGVYDEEHYRLKAEAKAQKDANRVKVIAGSVQIGDMIDGRKVLDLGVVWGKGMLQGQLWQPCARADCEKEPACAACERCAEHCYCDRQEWQYAYFTVREKQ